MLRSFLISLALTATTVLSQCPTHYDYSVTDRMAPQINGAVSAKINGSQTLFAQQVNVMSAVNATGIALYPRNSGAQTGPYNVTAAIYPDPALGSLNAIAVTNFRVGNQWAQYNQTNEMQPFIVSFPNLVQLNAGSYYVAFIAANMTASPPSDPFGNYLLEWATATNSVISRGFPVNDTFSYSPMNVTVINGSVSIDSGILVSIVSQPTSCAPDLSSSSSSTGGNSSTSSSSTGDNSAMSDHHVSSNLLIVVAIVVSACLL